MIYIGLEIKDQEPKLGLIFGIIGIFGFYMVLLILVKHKKFRLSKTDKSLTVQQIGRKTKDYKLENIDNWSEEFFIYRGEQKRTIKLTFKDQKRIKVTDKDDLMEYENLYHYLRINHRKK
uniref:Uncharacterized protein n=1 Tax=Roseihalotalea indica TaxID=2867963 RepID=A0AA49JJJ2_9BACT|nr:hypothetical protein K4G66_14035 [Tunicatimonas sp. TK19036]